MSLTLEESAKQAGQCLCTPQERAWLDALTADVPVDEVPAKVITLLSTPEERTKMIGKHIDEVLQTASRNGYAVNVVYSGKVRSAGRRVLTVKLDQQNRITHIA